MTGAKKKRVSKKTKQSWRKHVDIKDVEEYLEEKRADERLGAPIEILPDQDLFKIDVKPIKKGKLTIKEKRKILYNAVPRCYQILQPSTKVSDPISKRNRVRTKEERKDRIVKSIEEDRKIRGIVKAKDRIAAQNRQYNKAKNEANLYKKGDFKQDLWDVEDYAPTNELLNEWNNSDTIRHNYQGLGKLRKHIPKSIGKKISVLPKIEAPHPGMSYNPSFKDHQALLHEIAEKEIKIMKEEKHLDRVTTKMFKKMSPSKKEQSWLVEMSEGLNASKIGTQDSDSEGDFKSINPPSKNVKKDPKQRRKAKEQRALEEKRRRAKMEKKKIADIYKLKVLNREIRKTDLKVQQLREKREKKEEYKVLEPKRLGSRKFEAPDLDFNMGQDISGNLRSMKSEGNLLRDRFKSLQKRNILEPTAKQPPKKRAKVKKFEKASHKMGWEPKGH